MAPFFWLNTSYKPTTKELDFIDQTKRPYILRAFKYYTTTRELHVKSTLLATIRLIIIVLVWAAYLGSLDFNLKNVYQRSCKVDGAITIKLKGQLNTENVPDVEFAVPNPGLYKRTYDATDLIHPPFGDSDGSFLAVTNILITPNQTRGICPESMKNSGSKCSHNKKCTKGQKTLDGIKTGDCDPISGNCLLSSWCPVLENTLPLKQNVALLEGVANFTLLIKNSVGFPDCEDDLKDEQHHYRNIVDSFSSDYLTNCLHAVGQDDLCPIFNLGDVVAWSGHDFATVAVSGGIFKIELVWNCDFDLSWSKKSCFPNYKFERVDEHKSEGFSSGFSIWESFYHEENRRTQIKMYGIKFLIVVSGEGKKFDALQLVLAFGATIALFDLAPVVCDSLFHFFCFLKRFTLFQKHFGDFSVKSRHSDGLHNGIEQKFNDSVQTIETGI